MRRDRLGPGRAGCYAPVVNKNALAVILMAASLACGTRPAPPPEPAYDRATGLATFDRAWQIINDTHFDSTFNGVDWGAVRDSLRPQAAAAESRRALRRIINDMLDRLGQSHFALIPAEIADTLVPAGSDSEADDAGPQEGDVGLDVRLVDGQVLVTTVDSGGPAYDAGVRPGWVVVTVGDVSVDDLLERLGESETRLSTDLLAWRATQSRLAGEPGSTLRVEFLDAGDRRVTRDLVRRVAPSQPVKLGSFPTFFARAAHRELRTPGGRSAGYVWFNGWLAPLLAQLDSAVDAYRDASGFIVDLRGNTGGMGAMVMGVAGHFFDERLSIGRFATRQTTLEFVANPRRASPSGTPVRPFAGPVALLVDEGSASASEVFAGGMQAVGRVRVFGRTSAGAVLGARWDRLPNDDVLYHAFADFITPSGVRLEGRGVVPDEAVPMTRAALLEGRDPPLAAALEWIDAQHRSR